MAPRLSGQISIFGVVFFVSKSPLGIERQKKLEKFANFDPKASEPCLNIDISNVAYWQLKLKLYTRAHHFFNNFNFFK